MEMNKYQTLPGKLSRSDMNGDREQYSTPDQLSPDDSEDSEFHLSKSHLKTLLLVIFIKQPSENVSNNK